MAEKKKSVAKKKVSAKSSSKFSLSSLPALPSFCQYLSEVNDSIHVDGDDARAINAVLGAVAKEQGK